jgi:hypothetical protein
MCASPLVGSHSQDTVGLPDCDHEAPDLAAIVQRGLGDVPD